MSRINAGTCRVCAWPTVRPSELLARLAPLGETIRCGREKACLTGGAHAEWNVDDGCKEAKGGSSVPNLQPDDGHRRSRRHLYVGTAGTNSRVQHDLLQPRFAAWVALSP